MNARAPRRRPWLLPVLVAVFLAVAIVEVWLLTLIGTRIGVLPTLLVLFAEAFLGAWLMSREGRKAWRALVEAYSTGRLPSGQLADAALVLVGGLLLILPGFLTDVIGLVFLLPWSRPLARRAVGILIARHSQASSSPNGSAPPRADDPQVIPGEVVE